jgi:hypothetical protein
MPGSIFDDKSDKPGKNILIKKLGVTGKYWIELKDHLEEKHGPLREEWKFYGKKYGWQLKVLRKKRNLFFLIPSDGFFRIVFVFGDKAVSVVDKSDLSDVIKNTLRNARKYTEGRGLPIDVRLPEDVDNVKQLVSIKIEN